MTMWTRGVCAVLVVLQAATPAWAGPLGGSVAAGQATIGSAGAVTEVRQSTDRAIVNWQSFSTAAGESVRFVQPSAASVTLNRVTGNAASSLNGSLSANGRVFISNPNGIHFGSTSKVNVGSLVASTLAISDGDFMRGHHRFTDSGKAPASVVNDGHIQASGSVALVAPLVANHGTISAPNGRVLLAAGSAAQVDLDSGLVRLEATAAAPRDVVAGTDGNANPLAQVVNNQALVEAGGVVTQDGRVILKAAEGTALNTGRLEARQVVIDSTRVSAVTAGSRTHGDDVRLLSRGHAALPAGSRLSSSGGFVEVSGKSVTLAGSVDTGGGRLLIDPDTLTIQDVGDGTPNTVGVDFINGSTGDLTLEAESSISIENTLPIDMNGRNLTLRVTPVDTGDLGNVTAVGSPQIINAGKLTIEAGSAGAPVDIGNFDLAKLAVFGGEEVEISVFGSANSTISLGTILATGRITVNADTGLILKGSTAGVDLLAPDITLIAGRIGDPVGTPIDVVAPGTLTLHSEGDIGVLNQVAADTLVVVTDAIVTNRILVDEGGGNTILTAPGTNTIAFTNDPGFASNLDFTLTTGDLTLNTVDAGSSDLSLAALSGNLTGDVNTTGHLELEASGDIAVTNTSVADAVTVRIPNANTSQVSLSQNGAVEVEITGRVTSSVDSFRLITQSGDIDVKSITATSARLEARGGDILANATTFTGETLVLIAADDIRGTRLIDGRTVTLDAGGDIGTGAPVVIHAIDELTLRLRDDGRIKAFLDTAQPAILKVDLAKPGTPISIEDINEAFLEAGTDGVVSTTDVELVADLRLVQRTGDLLIGELISSGPVKLTAERGAVLVAPGERIQTDRLEVEARDGVAATDGSAVRIETRNLQATTDTGDLLFQELDGTRVLGARTGRGRFALASDDGAILVGGSLDAPEVLLVANGPTGAIDFQTGAVVNSGTARFVASTGLDLEGVTATDLLELTTTAAGATIVAELTAVPTRLSVGLAAPDTVTIVGKPLGDLLVATAGGPFSTPVPALGGLPLLNDLTLSVATGNVDLAADLIPGVAQPFSIAGDLTVNAPGGSIRLGDGQLVSAGTLSLTAAGAIGSKTGGPGIIQARRLDATSATGDVSLAAQGDLVLGASTSGGDFRLGVNGDLTLAGNVTANRLLQLDAAGDILDSGGVDHVLSGQRVALSGDDLGDGARPLAIAAQELDAVAQDDLFLRALTSVNARTLTAGDQLALQGLANLALGALSGSAVLVQSFDGAITDANGAAANVTSPNGTVGLFATRGVGTGDAIETKAAALVARTATGNIEIAEFDTAGLSATATAGDVKVSSDSGWLILDAVVAGGRAELRAVFGGLLDANGNALNVTAQSILFALCDTAGTVSDALEIRAGSLDATAFGVFVEADGALRVDQLTSTFTNRIRATGDVTLGRLASTRGIVDVISVDGAILDGNGGAVNLVVASGGESRLIAGTTIGVGDALEVDLAPGFLAVAAGAARGGVSAAIDGSTAPGNFVNVLSAPGSVLFRGRVQGNGPTGTGQPSDGNAAARTDPAQSLAASIEGRGSVSAAESAGSNAAGPRERSDLIDDSRAND